MLASRGGRENQGTIKMPAQLRPAWRASSSPDNVVVAQMPVECRVRKKPTSGVEVGVVEVCGSWEE